VGYLLDTNVVSELARPFPDKAVLAFLEDAPDLWMSVITLHELHYGVVRLPDVRRKAELAAWLERLKSEFAERIVPVSAAIAERSALLRVHAASQGRACEPLDAMIAATALERGLLLATRNVRDFDTLGVPLKNPWG
jgi:predicted nucleic acid-binding protein